MEKTTYKCSLIDHKDNDSISFCSKCKIYMCNKCEKHHFELFKYHNSIKLENNKNMFDNFTGICNEVKHINELIYFCKSHNKLCCAQCIIKFQTNENGKHTNCDLCLIEDIENEKRNKLEDNIKYLENLSINLEESINKLKKIFEKINVIKEDLKTKVQKVFTNLRNAINDREDKLLLDIDNKFDSLYLSEEIIKKAEKLPPKIKTSLEKGKLISIKWKDNKLNSLINDCLNIEKNIEDIKNINERINKYNSFNSEICFNSGDKESTLLDIIKQFGNIEEKKSKLFDSKIDFDEDLVKLWLNNREFKTELLFRKTRDGSTPKDFQNKCDNKGITIIFIETTKGYKFGGYTELQWDDHDGYKKDKSTFIFSFNNKEKYLARNDNESIYCSSREGPRFGCGWPDIYLYRSLNKGQSWDDYRNTFLLGRKLTNGEEFWDVKELEVYKITY